MDLRLKGKSVLITGGSKGIGLACAKAFSAEGCRVHLAARDKERLTQAAKPLGAATHSVDLRDAAALPTPASPTSPRRLAAATRSTACAWWACIRPPLALTASSL